MLWIDTSASESAHASGCADDDDDDLSRLVHNSQRCFARVLESTTTDAVRSDKKLSTNSGGIGRFEEVRSGRLTSHSSSIPLIDSLQASRA